MWTCGSGGRPPAEMQQARVTCWPLRCTEQSGAGQDVTGRPALPRLHSQSCPRSRCTTKTLATLRWSSEPCPSGSTLPFLQQYREAAQAAADDITGYKRLQACLRMWSVRARLMPQVLAERPNYYEEVEAERQAIRDGTIQTYDFWEAIGA
jgi:hypothetical protein